MPDPQAGGEIEEELPQPHRREHRRLRRATGPVLALVVAIGLVAGVITVRSSGDDPNATRTTTVSPDAPASATASTPAPLTGGQDPAICPSTVSCSTSDTVPRSVLAAIRTVLPGAQQRYATSVLTHRDGSRSRLWFRRVEVSSRRFNILVEVQQSSTADDPRSESDDDGTKSHTIVGRLAHGLSISVQADGLSGLSIGLADIQHLAADRRLLVVA